MAGDPTEFLKSAKHIVFLGDSITNDGRYISVIETRLRQEGIDPLPELLNLGLPSEGCTGLTEPGHPFPRPNVHERLERVLEKANPDVVVACYGINDGIYHPFSEDRFAAYQSGMRELVEKVHATGAMLILMTPPAFDPLPMAKQGKLAKIDAPKFAWTDIYEDYDAVMARYAEWVMELCEPVEMVVDWHGTVNAHLARERATNPDYVMSKDGVHMDAAGQTLLAEPILQNWGFSPGGSMVNADLLALVDQRQQLLHSAWLTYTGHTRPGVKDGLPLEDAMAKAAEIEQKINALIAGNHRGSDDFENLVRALPESEQPQRLFNGFNLAGWEGDHDYWSVSEGMIRGANEDAVPSSTYLFTEDSYRSFRLLLEVKQTMSQKHSTMHSAVAALGEQITDSGDNPFGFRGPLLMFCHDWGIWDAHRRNRVEPAGHRTTLHIDAERKGDWNLVEFLVKDDRIRCAANGVEVFDFTDQPEMLKWSPIGLQLHSNQQPQEYHFRGLVLSTQPGQELVSVKKR
ncbi:MAG: lysophospholipase L1-like esterase [Verrucomicrobiales bacterium]|jgi:lysophospholipase L1-like esterase